MDLFCICGNGLRSWGPVDVNFDSDEPDRNIAPLNEQFKGGVAMGFFEAILVFFKILGEIIFAFM
jgi:hypothetical protein